VQVVLISAVIGNADEISQWLIGGEENSIIGHDLHPTYRTIAFASWIDRLGQLQFVEPDNLDQPSFFVPRILETQELALRRREKSARLFPKPNEPGQIATYLACKLVHNGSVAIFSGRKDSAGKMADDIIEAFSRGLRLTQPSRFCDPDELGKLISLYRRNLGDECTQTKSAQLGIFLHHSNTPHGIRLALEYALQKNLIHYVICTSTLAQGVNLPLRYLIVTTDRQGRERIKIRDFHNLMGRAGRAGKYTEGSILFANPLIFDRKLSLRERWRWRDAKNLLNPARSEPCKSFILALLDPLVCRDAEYNAVQFKINPIRLAKLFYEDKSKFDGLPDVLAARVAGDKRLRSENRSELARQLKDRGNAFQSIGAFLVQFVCEAEDEGNDFRQAAADLLRHSLAFHQATEAQKNTLQELFLYLQERLLSLEPSHERRKVFAKTVFDIPQGQVLMEFMNDVIPRLSSDLQLNDLLELFWPVIYEFNTNTAVKSCRNEETLKTAGIAWLEGESFAEILTLFGSVRFGTRNATIDHVVEVCENGFGYQGSMIIGACIDMLGENDLTDQSLMRRLRFLQKALKYGLSSESEIAAYELGIAERFLAKEIAQFIPTIPSKRNIVISFKRNLRKVRRIFASYPSYFESKLEEIISE
jgi:hypothetical protein